MSSVVTYVGAECDSKTRRFISKWLKENHIVNPVKPGKLHCTLIFSKNPCPSVEKLDLKLPVTATFTEFKMFDDGTTLVGVLDSPELSRYHFDAVEQYGATHDYIEFVPHITLAKNYTGDVPTNMPQISPTFDKLVIREIDVSEEDYKQSKRNAD